MKTKKLFFVFFVMSFFPYIIYAQPDSGDSDSQFELYLHNLTSESITAVVYPAGMVFNGTDPPSYNPIATNRLFYQTGNQTKVIDYVLGSRYHLYQVPPYNYTGRTNIFQIQPNSFLGLNYDKWNAPMTNDADGIFGRGIYKIVYKWNTDHDMDSVLFEQDAGDNWDTRIFIVDDRSLYGGPPSRGLVYQSFIDNHGTWGPIKSTTLVNGYIKSWDYYPYIPTAYRRNKEFGNYVYSNGETGVNNPYTTLPIDPRRFTQINQYNQYHFFPNPLHDWNDPNLRQIFDDRFGILSLNMSITKSVSSPTTVWDTTGIEIWGNYTAKPAHISIQSGATLSIGKTPAVERTILSLNTFTNITDGTDLIVNGPNSEFGAGKLDLKYSQNHNTDAQVIANDYCNIFLRPGSQTRIERYGNIILQGTNLTVGGKMVMEETSEIYFEELGEIIIKSGGTLDNCGAVFTNNNNSCIFVEPGGVYNNPGINCNPFTHTVDNGALIYLNGGTINIGDNSKIVFDGAGTRLIVKPGSTINFGQNAKIEFKNGAYIDADGGTFTSNNSWGGIFLEDAGSQTLIKNCTFNNASKSISILNTSTGAYETKTIKDNEFNIPSSGTGIYAENVFRIILQGNDFNMTSNSGKGFHLTNTIVPSSEGTYDLKMIGNEFTGGQVQAALIAQTTEYLPFYIYGNKFYGTALYNLVGRKLVGNIKQNSNLTSTTTTGFHLTQSIPLLYKNKITTSGNSIYLGSNSFPRMAPIIDPYSDFLWYGGQNELNSSGMDNIYILSGYPVTDYGTNSFTISSTQNFHLEGYLPDTTGEWYYTRNNCWYGNSGLPWTNLKKLGNIPVPPLYENPNYNCNYTYTEDSPIIDDLGDGVYDTVIVTETNTSDTISLDEVSYGQAVSYHEESSYSMAIIEYKALIDSFPASSYIYAVPDLLYDCYSSLDTTGSQDATDSLFSDLKLYMENKINSAEYDKTFNDECYDVILMCEAMMENYYDALTGYEFISLYHPDPETRLLASMDYSDIEDLLGQGGGMKNIVNNVVNIKNRKKVLDRLSDRDPVMKVIKKGYENQTKALDRRQTKEDKIKRFRVNSEVDMNVQRNLYSSRNLTKEEKRIRNNENMLVLLSIGDVMTGKEEEVISVIPKNYKLEQNYPNPFNPTTTINYSIPKDGLVNIKIYDITGREIRTLVNEIKVTGNYSITFNGSSLASGVYFYRIEAGNFVETKQMVLVK